MPDATPFYVNWTTGQHTAADVPTTAQGTCSGLLGGTFENTAIHSAMLRAVMSHAVWMPLVQRQ